MAAVRVAVGADYPIGLRLSQWKQQDFKARLVDTPAQLAQLVEPLSEAGVDLFHGSTRRYWEPAFEGSDLNFAGWLRKLSGKPAITVGSVGLDSTSFRSAGVAAIDPLLERLARGEFDLVAVGRAFLADPTGGLSSARGGWARLSLSLTIPSAVIPDADHAVAVPLFARRHFALL